MKLKKILICTLSCSVSIFRAFSAVSFGGMDVDVDGNMLYTVHHEISGTPSYTSLFSAKLGKTSLQGKPTLLTCYPEQLELLNGGKTLQIRNRYGTAWYSATEDRLRWISVTEALPTHYLRPESQKSSPDGKWIVIFRPTADGVGQFVVQDVQNQSEQVFLADHSDVEGDVAVKWAPDSSAFLYQKDGFVYFATPQSLFRRTEQLPENYRKIGKGNLTSVEWLSSGNIIYIDNDIIYLIQKNELFTRGLYSALIGSGTIIGRLGVPFNFKTDLFFANPQGSELIIISDGKIVSYYETTAGNTETVSGYKYVNTKGMYPLSNLSGIALHYSVFWNENGNPVLWIDILDYEDGGKSSQVYMLSKTPRLLLDIKDSLSPKLSPDRRYLAFTAEETLFIFDSNTWEQIASLSGEKVQTFVWASSINLYVGGEKTIKRWSIGGDEKVISLSSVDSAIWDAGRVIAKSGEKNYTFDFRKNTWGLQQNAQNSTPVLRENLERNAHYRVFLGASGNSGFSNAIFVRSLSNPVVTYPLLVQTEDLSADTKKIALIFDLTDNADGLGEVLYALETFSIPATFFVNGEFIRRYPLETRQIAQAGFLCGSSFYSTADLADGSFIVTEDFIKRGLARNEDEFFAVTEKELSLLWHAPFYKTNALLQNASRKAGYRTIEPSAFYVPQNGKIGEVIAQIKNQLQDKSILQVDVENAKNIDVLIASLLDSGFLFVNLKETF